MTPGDVMPPQPLDLGRHAAFHGAPVVGIAPLQGLLATTTEPEIRDEARWLLAVCQGASGLYGSALHTLEPLWVSEPFAGHAHLVAASIHRQLGHFDSARHHDEQALFSTSRSVRCEAFIGLAADAVGCGEADLAAGQLAHARQAWRPDWWREGIRLEWVCAELALLTNRATAAPVGLRGALEVATTHDAPRHVAKTQGFLAVSLHSAFPEDVESRREAMGLLDHAAGAAQALAAWPLVWAFRRIQWHWLQCQGEEASAEPIREHAARAVALILADLPAHMRPGFRRRPDVADLLVYDD